MNNQSTFYDYEHYHHHPHQHNTHLSISNGNNTGNVNAHRSSVYKTPRVYELKHKILESYLSYLSREDTPDKLIHRSKLEQLITEYLCLVPHAEKYETPEVAECLDRSIVENSEFSAYRAAAAFEILEKYANNLLTKPWRKEFQIISPYGGFFNRLIERQLRGASGILELLGYRKQSINGIESWVNPSCALDPDILARVSLDCAIAVVELQLIIKIADVLKRKAGLHLSWLQIFEIRNSHVCTAEDVVNYVLESNSVDDNNLIKCPAPPTSFSSSTFYVNNNISTRRYSHPTAAATIPSAYLQQHQNGCPLRDHSMLKKNDYHHPDDEEAQDLMHFSDPHHPVTSGHHPHHQHNHYTSNYHNGSASGHNLPYIAPPPMFASNYLPYHGAAHHGSGYHHAMMASTIPAYQSTTPTTSASGASSSNSSTNSNSSTSSGTAVASSITVNRRHDQSSNHSISGSGGDTLDARFNSMSLKTSGVSNSSQKSSNSQRSLDRIRKDAPPPPVSDSGTGTSQSFQTFNNSQQDTRKVLKDSTNMAMCVNTLLEENIASLTKSLASKESNRHRKSSGSGNEPSQPSEKRTAPERPSDLRKAGNENFKVNGMSLATSDDNRVSENEDTWSCAYCTFLNSRNTDAKGKDICEMCSRSRDDDREETKLISGGKVCPRCTLVNTKEAKNCSACESSLLNSPTYI